MNIVLRELRANIKSLIIWSCGMALFVYIGMVKYSGFQAAGQSVNEFFEQIPAAMKSVLGMNGLDLTTVAAFYSIFFFYFMLLAGAHAVMLGAVIISKEERDKTADFLFVKPIVRNRVITSKLIAALINIIALNLVTLAASIFFVDLYNNGEPINREIANLMLALFFIQLIFLSIGAAVAAIARNTKKATSLATSLLLSAFMLSVAIDLYHKLDFLSFLTPFKYFKTAEVMRAAKFEPLYLLLSAFIIIASTAATYKIYEKRDIHI